MFAVYVLFGLSSVPAFAYKYWTDCGNSTPRKWAGNSLVFNANPTGFGGDYYYWLESFNVAASRFGETPVNFNVAASLDNDLSVGIGNGESEIWWSADGNSAVAYTVTNPCGNIVEGDIIFHNTVPYWNAMYDKTVFWNYGGNKRTFETTAIHEVGHTLGLAHENRYYNIMGTDYTYVQTEFEGLLSYVGEDATNGLAFIYGQRTSSGDLSVSSWRYSGSSGEYSSHKRTRLFNRDGSLLPSSDAVNCGYSNCEKRYRVYPGQEIQYEMTLENNGSNSHTVSLGFYISTRIYLGPRYPDSILISTDTVTIARNTPDTITRKVRIPQNLLPNTDYYFGVMVDNNEIVPELNENNNISYNYLRTNP